MNVPPALPPQFTAAMPTAALAPAPVPNGAAKVAGALGRSPSAQAPQSANTTPKSRVAANASPVNAEPGHDHGSAPESGFASLLRQLANESVGPPLRPPLQPAPQPAIPPTAQQNPQQPAATAEGDTAVPSGSPLLPLKFASRAGAEKSPKLPAPAAVSANGESGQDGGSAPESGSAGLLKLSADESAGTPAQQPLPPLAQQNSAPAAASTGSDRTVPSGSRHPLKFAPLAGAAKSSKLQAPATVSANSESGQDDGSAPESGFASLLKQSAEDPAGTPAQPPLPPPTQQSSAPAAAATGGDTTVPNSSHPNLKFAPPAATSLTLTVPGSPGAKGPAGPAKSPKLQAPAAVIVPVPDLPVQQPLRAIGALSKESGQKESGSDAAPPAASSVALLNQASQESPSRLDLAPPSVLEVSIRSEAPKPVSSPTISSPTVSEQVVGAAEPDALHAGPANAAPAPGPTVEAAPALANTQLAAPVSAAAPPPVRMQPESPSGSTRSAVASAHPLSISEPEEPKAQTPLRSVSLEFTPDGAQDVRVRLSERAGDVHISLHTTDPSLTQRISEGVHDLAGSLAGAGYDAQAWTPDSSGQRQRNPQEEPRSRPQGSSGQTTDAFDNILQQNPEENA